MKQELETCRCSDCSELYKMRNERIKAVRKKQIKILETSQGTAYYLRTEVEDKNGKWNDSYNVKDGYYLIHQGNNHEVYRLRGEQE